jgi:Zn-dependent peptidase ImmA (M78 family)/transcriptional regulator with XRE-family HTH domain
MNSCFPIHLKAARLRLGWSLDQLAAKAACVTKSMLSKYEQGASMPSREVLQKLSAALGVSPTALLTENAVRVEFVAFRKTNGLSVKEANRIRAEVEWRLRHRWDLMRIVGESPVPAALPHFGADTASVAEAHASMLRQTWALGIGPLPNLTNLLEDHGFEVVVVQADSAFSGISAWVNEAHPVVVVQKRDKDGARQRMDLAHELAHLVGHPATAADEEEYAKLFAGAFLFPETAVRREFPVRRNRITLAELKAVKAKYGISFEGILYRLRELSILSQEGYRWWYEAGAIRRKELSELLVPVEAASHPIRLASRALTEGLIGLKEIAEGSDVAMDDLKEQAPKPRETLQQQFLSMSHAQRKQVIREEAERLAEHLTAHPEEILPDITDGDAN